MQYLKRDDILFESAALKGNPLRDPHKREIAILEPAESEGRPIMIFLSGYGGSSLDMLNRDPLGEDMKRKAERLIKRKLMKGSVMIFPDTFTRVGGNQYLNSTAVGMYEDFIIKELVPYLKEKYSSESVALLGKSSGGYGAITLAMKHPGVVSAAADHSGDAYFEYCYIRDFPDACREISKYGSAEKWLNAYWKKENKRLQSDMAPLGTIGMAAFYSPNGTRIELPFEMDTCEIRNEVWRKWIEKDPVRMVGKYYGNLKKLKMLMIDVGTEDEYGLNWGNRILHKRLIRHGVKHVYEEFEGGHRNTSYRYDRSMPLVEKALYQQ
ncbi:MAG: alpha/beta hydrolase [Candidatus Micrarchaeia archaeon]